MSRTILGQCDFPVWGIYLIFEIGIPNRCVHASWESQIWYMYGDSSLDGGVMHTTSNQIWCMYLWRVICHGPF